ncbi:MAG: T9SS type A sorting domain-containing protein [bacterium]
MKPYLFFIVIGCITIIANAQSHFPDSNAIWNVNFVNSFGTPTGEIYYGLKGDTLINDTLYYKLYTLSDTALTDENLEDYIGGFRQDNQKVWFKPAYWSYQDILLYDFSASVGDTVWHKGVAYYNYSKQIKFEFGNEYSIIQEIKTENDIKIYSTDREAEYLAGEWYEKIGSNFGLFGSIVQFPLIGDTYKLACFKHNDTVKYQNNLMCDECFCNGQTSLIEVNKDGDVVEVSSHPTENFFEITVNRPYGEIFIEIFDRKGRIIYRKKNIENPIKLPDRNPGLFFVKLRIDDEVIVKKAVMK